MKVTVYHPQSPDFNGGYTVFSGDNINVEARNDGSLVIANWETVSETGSAIFAKGAWGYVCISAPLTERHS